MLPALVPPFVLPQVPLPGSNSVHGACAANYCGSAAASSAGASHATVAAATGAAVVATAAAAAAAAACPLTSVGRAADAILAAFLSEINGGGALYAGGLGGGLYVGGAGAGLLGGLYTGFCGFGACFGGL